MKKVLILLFISSIFSCYVEEDHYPYGEDKAWVEPKATKENIILNYRVIGEDGNVLSEVRTRIGRGFAAGGDLPHPTIGLKKTNAETQGDCVDLYFGKDDYFSNFRTITAKPNSNNFTTIKLKKRGQGTTINVEENNEINHISGVKVIIPEKTINITPTGINEAQVHIKYVDPNSEDHMEQKIGGELGISKDNDLVGLHSYGMVQISAPSGNKDRYEYSTSNGASIIIEIPLPNGISTRPEEIPMWLFDETEGIWLEKGLAKLSGDKYIAELDAFLGRQGIGSWNLASIAEEPVDFTAKVFVDGIPAPNHLMKIKYHDGFKTGAYTNTEGEMYLKRFRGDEQFTISIFNQCGEFLETQNSNGISGNETIIIDLKSDGNGIDFRGRALDCEGKPLTDGAIFYNFFRYQIDETGYFSIPLCLSTSDEFIIIDPARNITKTFVVSEISTLENLQVCADPGLQYLVGSGRDKCALYSPIKSYTSDESGNNEITFEAWGLFRREEDLVYEKLQHSIDFQIPQDYTLPLRLPINSSYGSLTTYCAGSEPNNYYGVTPIHLDWLDLIVTEYTPGEFIKGKFVDLSSGEVEITMELFITN